MPSQLIENGVEAGAIIGLYALDEPHDWARFGSCKELQPEDVNQVCAYAHKKWPKISCGVNAPLRWLIKGLQQSRFDQLDFLFTQYNTRQGDISHWIATQLSDAKFFKGKKLFLSINAVANNPGPDELMRAGKLLCAADVNGVFMWRWGETFKQPAMLTAMYEVSKACNKR